MASQEDIERTYDYMDEALRLSLGECLDLSCAFYDGDYGRRSLSTGSRTSGFCGLSASG